MGAGASNARITRSVRRLMKKYPDMVIRVDRASNGEVAILVVCPTCREPKWVCSHPDKWKD